MLNVEPNRLTRHTVPMICAKTGVPATRVIRQTLIERGSASPWLLLLGTGFYFWTRVLNSSAVTVELPASDAVHTRYRALRVARLVAFGGIVSIIVATGSWHPAVPVFAVWLLLGWAARRGFATATWNGAFVRLDAHPALLSALREPVAPLRPQWVAMPEPAPEPAPAPAAPPPGWYADPWGLAGLRLWDGTAWTGHVAEHPA